MSAHLSEDESPVETLLASVLAAHRYMATNQASQTGCHGCHWTFPVGQTERGRRAHEAHVAAELDEELREAGLLAWVPNAGTIEDDLRSRLGCVMEATWWDRPYDTRLDAIRGMCDLTTDGMTPAADDAERTTP